MATEEKKIPAGQGLPELTIQIERGGWQPDFERMKRLALLKPVCRCKGDSATGEITEPCGFHKNAIAMFEQLRALVIMDHALRTPNFGTMFSQGEIQQARIERRFENILAQIQRLVMAVQMRAEKDEAEIVDLKPEP